MKYLGSQSAPPWVQQIAEARAWPLASTADPGIPPADGDIVLKPVVASDHRRRFRVETWRTHAPLDGPFETAREALSAALELGVTSRLAVWLDYSDDPATHDLNPVPLYRYDPTGDPASVA